jgi:hypothetical protein
MKESTNHDKKVYDALMLLAGGSKSSVVEMRGCYLHSGGIISVDGYASVNPDTLIATMLKVTVIDKSASATVAVGDVITDVAFFNAVKVDCCPL